MNGREYWQRCLSMYMDQGSFKWMWRRPDKAPQHIDLRMKMLDESNKLFKQLVISGLIFSFREIVGPLMP